MAIRYILLIGDIDMNSFEQTMTAKMCEFTDESIVNFADAE